MKFTIQRESLLKPLQAVVGVVERRHTLPILANILLTVKQHQLALLGTDLEVEMIGRVELTQPAEAGQITVPARKLLDICRNMPDNSLLQFALEENRMIVKAGRSRFVLQTLNAVDFPYFDAGASAESFAITQGELRYLLEQTHFAIAQQDVRYYLNGMLLELNKQQLRSVATDGHRMAMCTIALSHEQAFRQVIVPRKGVNELLRLLEDGDEAVMVSLGQHHLRVEAPEFTLTSKLIDGRYPDYHKVLPQPSNRVISLDRDEFKQALNRVAILSSEKFRGLKLKWVENTLILEASNPEHEEAEERLEVNYLGDTVTLGFNVAYLVDVLSALPAGQVRVIISETVNSLLVESAEAMRGPSLYVIMSVLL